MRRGQRQLTALLVAVSLAAILGAGCARSEATTAAATPGKPNIVFILTDDLSTAALNRNLSEYPNIEALLDGGVRFRNAFVTNPVCCPSRVTFLTGQYKHNHGIDMNNAEPAFQDLDDKALPVWLDGEGYKTGYFGKYLNEYQGDHTPPGWDVWGGTRLRDKGEDGATTAGVPGFDDEGLNSEGQTHTQVFAQEAASFVRDADGPFFAFVSPFAPHQPAAHPKKYDSLFTDARAPRTPSFNERLVSDKPPWISKRNEFTEAQIATIDETYRDMLRSTKDVDDMVGTIVDALRESGKLDSTYIVFTSDNGFHYGQHRLMLGKWMPYEEDIRVPLIISGPGISAGEARYGFVLNTDLAPTFAAWAGVDPISAGMVVDGRSLEPLIASEATSWRNAFLVEAIRNNFKTLPRPPFTAIRTGRFTYVQYASGAQELYDLERDPYELNNLAGKRPAIQAMLSKRLDALKSCVGDGCRAAEGP